MRSLIVRMERPLFLALSLCPLWVNLGDTVSVTVRWAHEESPGVLYTYRVGPTIISETGRATVAAEGLPVGCQWVLNGHEVIFYDDFEEGGAGAWQR